MGKFKSKPNEQMKIHFKKKKKCDIPLDNDYRDPETGKMVQVVKLPPELPNISFLWLLVGPPRSGKSSYIESLLTHPVRNGVRQSYIHLFKEIIFFTPEILDYENEAMAQLTHVYDELNLENLNEAWDIALKTYENEEQTLIVFDDMGSNLRNSGVKVQKRLEHICFNHRHRGASVFFAVQTYKSLSPDMRKVSGNMTVFKMTNQAERDAILSETSVDPSDYGELCNFIFESNEPGDKRRHNLYIDSSQTRHSKTVVYKDFDEIIID